MGKNNYIGENQWIVCWDKWIAMGLNEEYVGNE